MIRVVSVSIVDTILIVVTYLLSAVSVDALNLQQEGRLDISKRWEPGSLQISSTFLVV